MRKYNKLKAGSSLRLNLEPLVWATRTTTTKKTDQWPILPSLLASRCERFLLPFLFFLCSFGFFSPSPSSAALLSLDWKWKLKGHYHTYCVHAQPSTTANSWILHRKLILSKRYRKLFHYTIYQLSEQGYTWYNGSLSMSCNLLPSLAPRLPPFFFCCSSVCIQYNTRKRKSGKQSGRSGNTYHVNDVWWMWGVVQTHVQ